MWENKLSPTPAPPAVSTLNNLADPVSLRFTMKRFELVPRNWQVSRNADMKTNIALFKELLRKVGLTRNYTTIWVYIPGQLYQQSYKTYIE